MKRIITHFTIIVFLVIQSCSSNQTVNENKEVAEIIIENCDILDNSFIILKQKQGLFEIDSIGVDTLAILFNTALVSKIRRQDLAEKFNLNDFTESWKNDTVDIFGVTGLWNETIIRNTKTVPLKSLLEVNLDSLTVYNWKSFDAIKSKNFCIFSEPIYSKDKSTVIIGLQIYTDDLYYQNYYELRKLPEWTIIGEVSSKHEIIKFFLYELNESEIKIGLVETVFRGWN